MYGVRPDLTCLGKIIGGGLPVGAYGGRADLMEMVAPAGPVYQAGTLSGNPLAMAAGLWSLGRLDAGAVPRICGRSARVSPPGLADGGARRRHPAPGQRRRVALDAVLHRSPGARLPVGDQREHRALRGLLSRDARARHLSARRHNSKRGSCPPRTQSRTSIERWPPRRIRSRSSPAAWLVRGPASESVRNLNHKEHKVTKKSFL